MDPNGDGPQRHASGRANARAARIRRTRRAGWWSQVTQQVREVMTAGPVVVDLDTPVQQAATVMRDENIGAALVAEKGRLRGLVTDRD